MLCALRVRKLKPGTMEQFKERRAAADEFVESVGTDGDFEVVEERSME